MTDDPNHPSDLVAHAEEAASRAVVRMGLTLANIMADLIRANRLTIEEADHLLRDRLIASPQSREEAAQNQLLGMARLLIQGAAPPQGRA